MRVWAAALCLLWLGSAQALQAVTEDKPPYNWQTPEGQVSGFSVAVLGELLARSHLTLDPPGVRLLPWARAYQLALHTPDTLIFSTARIPERESLFFWIGPITGSHTIWFWRLRNRPEVVWEDDQDRQQWRVGVVRSSAYREQLEKEGFVLRTVNREEDKFQMLLLRRVDLIAAPEAEVRFQMRRLGKDPALLAPVSVYNHYYEYYFALNRRSDPELARQLQEALEGMRLDGALARLQQEWLE